MPPRKTFLLVVLIAVVVSVVWILLLRNDVRNQVSPTPAPTVQPIINNQQSAMDTSDWQTYRNEEFGFEVKYPEFLSPDILSYGTIALDAPLSDSADSDSGNMVTLRVDRNPFGEEAIKEEVFVKKEDDKYLTGGARTEGSPVEETEINGNRAFVGWADRPVYWIDGRGEGGQSGYCCLTEIKRTVILGEDGWYVEFEYLLGPEFDGIVSSFRFLDTPSRRWRVVFADPFFGDSSDRLYVYVENPEADLTRQEELSCVYPVEGKRDTQASLL